jgi:hypothetical protein
MLRFFLALTVVAALLAAPHPALAETIAPMVCNHAPVAERAEPAAEHEVPPAPAERPAPANGARGKEIVLIGFGWG